MKITVKLNGETAKVGPPEWGSGPDYFSFWSHFLGALFAVFATIQLLSIQGASVEKQVACLIYGACAVMMLSCSALHHAVQKPVSLPIQLLLRVLRNTFVNFGAGKSLGSLNWRWDHVSIYVFIAGSYTPIMVGSNLGLYTSRTILTAVWVLAVIGVCQKLFFNFSTMRYVTISTYICQGWACIFALPQLRATFGDDLQLLVAGGLFYSVGAFVYASKRPNLWPNTIGFHGLWHIFVLLGAFCHYRFVLLHIMGNAVVV